MSNRSTYEDDKVVHAYTLATDLYAPEQAILTTFADNLKHMRMLDIGVGAGRTTAYFAPLVKEYVGIDYSQKMLDVCRERFPHMEQSFHLCDARAMEMFPDDSFDFVLFSFNGIDYVSKEERDRVLREIARVSRHGAHFFFSAHNLNSDVAATLCPDERRGIRPAIRRLLNRTLFRMLNPFWDQRRQRAQHMVLNDGAHDFGLRTYYIRPDAQLAQLRAVGFADIKVMAADGKLLDHAQVPHATDDWLHYLSVMMKRINYAGMKLLAVFHIDADLLYESCWMVTL